MEPSVVNAPAEINDNDDDSDFEFEPPIIEPEPPSEPSKIQSAIKDTIGAVTTALVATATNAVNAVNPSAIETKINEQQKEAQENAAQTKDAIDKSLLSDLILNEREIIEKGLQSFNQVSKAPEFYVDAIETAIKNEHSTVAFIKLTPASPPTEEFSGPSIVSYCNPTLGALSDFVPGYNIYIFTNDLPDTYQPIMYTVSKVLDTILYNIHGEHGIYEDTSERTGPEFELKKFIPSNGQISLRLHVGKIFNIPIFTVHITTEFVNSKLPTLLTPIESEPFIHNGAPVGPYNRLDVVMELRTYSEHNDSYSPVNVLISRGINELCVKKFTVAAEGKSPNAIIQTTCNEFCDLVVYTPAKSQIIKSVLIAILQNPAVQTPDQKRFSDIFPSGQYGIYFNEIAYRCNERNAVGPLTVPLGEVSFPLTRTDIIVAAITAFNVAMRKNAPDAGKHIVASGGAAVSYYIREFLRDADANVFSDEVISASGANMQQVIERCGKIPMNDIDCFVFGDVSRDFLLVFSLYMMIMYYNFYDRPKCYGVKEAQADQIQKIRFNLLPELGASESLASDNITLFMYGNRNTDANTELISKRLKKNPKVQLVSQETKYFSQIVHPACQEQGSGTNCKEDEYYMQPIDLVKKELQEFIDLYRISLYVPDQISPPENLEAMVRQQYTQDNMVSLKTTMLDIICIFCDEGKSLFIRIFMARKNPKDFTRLRAFIDLYLLQLLRADPALSPEFIQDIGALRSKMDELNTKYYLEQGNLAAFRVETAAQLDEDRSAFLKLLRSIGRKIVDLPDPLGDRVPVTFQEATGENTIRFFNESKTMKYNFDMSQHIAQLMTIESPTEDAFSEWLSSVFSDIKCTRQVETFFQYKLEEIDFTDDSDTVIGFTKMPVRSPLMLMLDNALKKADVADLFTRIRTDTQLSAGIKPYRDMFNVLLIPVKEHIARYGVAPSAYYVGVKTKTGSSSDGMYPHTIKEWTFPKLIDFILSIKEKYDLPLMKNLDGSNIGYKTMYASLDDEVKEEIGRIILDLVKHYPYKLSGGKGHKTRKQGRRQHRRFNATTRPHNQRRGGVRILTRNKSNLGNGKGKRKFTRRRA